MHAPVVAHGFSLTRGPVQQFQQVLFLIFDEWDRARSDDAMLATDDVVELDPSGCTCGV